MARLRDRLNLRRPPADPTAAQMSAYAAESADRWAEQAPPPRGDRISAAIVPMTAYDFRGRGQWGAHWASFPWQEQFRRYARQGPGIVGLSADIPSQTSRLIRWRVQVQDRTTLEWENADDDAVAVATMRLFRNRHQTPEDLAAEMVWQLDGPGELISVRDLTDRGHEYMIMSKHNVTVDTGRPDVVEVRTRPGVDRGSHWYREVPITSVAHVHQADKDWPGLPASQFQRVLPDLESFLLISRHLGRNYRSRLALNGVLWAKATGAAQTWPDDIKSWGRMAYRDEDDRDVRSITPFGLITDSDDPPEWVRTHAPVEQIDIDVADWYLMAFCRGVDFPTKMLFDGPGTANHWGDYVINDYYADFVMWPRALRVADVWTHHVLRPWGRILDAWGDRDPERYRVWPDLTEVRTRTDNTDRILALGNQGVANREAMAEAAGLRPDQVLDIPDGISEAEWFLRANGKRSTGLDGEGPATEAVDLPADPRGPGGPPAGPTPPTANEAPDQPGDPDGPVRAGADGRFPGDAWDRDADLILV